MVLLPQSLAERCCQRGGMSHILLLSGFPPGRAKGAGQAARAALHVGRRSSPSSLRLSTFFLSFIVSLN